MPILLTTPLNMGAVDTNYTHAQIVEMRLDSLQKRITLICRHGTVSAGVFTAGKLVDGITSKVIACENGDYTTMVAKTTSAQGAYIYNEVARELYLWLIAQGHYAGTIV
jgi:hypothetical protein